MGTWQILWLLDVHCKTDLDIKLTTWFFLKKKKKFDVGALMSVSSKILALGFDEKFIQTWEYYFDYSAAGFKSRTFGNH